MIIHRFGWLKGKWRLYTCLFIMNINIWIRCSAFSSISYQHPIISNAGSVFTFIAALSSCEYLTEDFVSSFNEVLLVVSASVRSIISSECADLHSIIDQNSEDIFSILFITTQNWYHTNTGNQHISFHLRRSFRVHFWCIRRTQWLFL